MPENLALYAIGGLAAAEATGVTNFTEIGGAGNDPEDNPLTGGFPPGLSQAFGSMAEALSATSGAIGAGRAPVDTSGISEIIAGQQAQIATLTENVGAGGGDAQIWHEIGRIRENIDTRTPDVPGSGGGGDGYGFTIPGGEGTNIGGLDSGGGFLSRGERFDLQDLAGTSRAGTAVAAGAEIMEETGGVAGGLADTFVSTGATYSEATKALLGREYSAEGTLAEGIYGTETRRINYPGIPDVSPSEGTLDTMATISDVGTNPVDDVAEFALSRTVGTASAETEGTTSESPGPATETEVNAGNYSTGGTGTGITSGAGDVASRITEEKDREKAADRHIQSVGIGI